MNPTNVVQFGKQVMSTVAGNLLLYHSVFLLPELFTLPGRIAESISTLKGTN